MDKLFSYFPSLSPGQKQMFTRAAALYREWNEKINVISRKDMDQLEMHHFIHSLSITRFISIPSDAKIIDVGTGGGFPGLPLAIYYPQVEFLLVDSIGKKLKVVEAIAGEIGLKNLRTQHSRAEEVKEKSDFVTGRAVTQIDAFYENVKHLLKPAAGRKGEGGILYLKGGEVEEELKKFGKKVDVYSLYSRIPEPFMETKLLLHIHTP